jgi:hypothetical protein
MAGKVQRTDFDSWVQSTYEPAQVHNISQPVTEPYTITLQASGPELGYSPEGFPIKLALAILLLYCLVALAHFSYTLISGISSSCWDSIAEVVALALNSERPTKLNHTTAGVETMSAFRHPFRICETEDRLGIIFQEDEQEQGKEIGMIVVNRKY